MSDFKEKHYSIDAGKGAKMDGCPYSFYEDGHDVQEYIIPPKGYVFVGFKLVLTPENQIYDGKLVAQYEREPIKDRLYSILHVLLWVFIIAVIIGLITILAVGVFRPQKPKNTKPEKPQTELPAQPVDTVWEEEETAIEVTKETTDTIEQVTDNQQEETILEEPIQQEEQPAIADDNQTFRQEFWTLIHERTILMDPYDGLYKQYKGLVSGEEFDYLRFTILKDSQAFKEWSTELRKISSADITSIETIDALKTKLKEIK